MAGRTYKQSLGLPELVSLGVGGTIGSGIFVVPGIAARMAGPGSLIAWGIVAASATCVLLSLAYTSGRFTRSKGFYSLFEDLFGVRVAVPLMLMYTVSSIFGVATIAAGIGQYLSFFSIPDLLAAEIGILAVFCVVNIIGIGLSSQTENVLTALKVIPLVVITLLLLPFIRPDHFVQSVPLTASGLIATVVIVYWPFTGFEISAIPVEETKDPGLIRRALLLVMLIVILLYLVLNVALIGSIGSAALGESPAPIAAASGMLFSRSGELVAIIGIIAMLSAMNAYILATSRILQALAERFRLPKIRDIGQRGTPGYALTAGCAASGSLLFFTNTFDVLATISVITTLVPYLFFCIAAWIIVPKRRARAIAAAGFCSTAAILLLFFTI